MWDLKPNRRGQSSRGWLKWRRHGRPRPPETGLRRRAPVVHRPAPILRRRASRHRLAALLALLWRLRPPPLRYVYAAVVVWLVLGLGAAGFVIWRAPLRTVEVQGNRYLTGREVVALAQLTPGTAMGEIDPYRLAERLTAHPLVKSVDVRRVFPDRVRITVRERVPAARVVFDNRRQGLIDDERTLLDLPAEAVAAAAHSLPLIVGAGPQQPPGTVLSDPVLLEGLRLLSAIAARGLGPAARVSMDIGDPFRILVKLPQRGHVLVLPSARATFALDDYVALSSVDSAALDRARRVDLRLAGQRGRGRIVVVR